MCVERKMKVKLNKNVKAKTGTKS